MLSDFIFKIKSRENNFFTFLYKLGKGLMSINIPCFKPLYKFLWWERTFRLGLWRWLLKVFYYTPLFQSMCFKAGKNLNLKNGLPYVSDNLKIIVGDNVVIYGDSGFQGYKVYKDPVLEIGEHTFIGPKVRIGVGKEIRIGKHCLIAARVFIADHDGHSLNWEKRRESLPVDRDEIKPIIIEDDVWIGEGAFICKGAKIGRGSIIAARAVVTKDVEPFSVVGGNPARLIKYCKDE